MDNFLNIATKIREKKNDKNTIKMLEEIISKIDDHSEYDKILRLMSKLFSNFNLTESSGIVGFESYSIYDLQDETDKIKLQLNFDNTDENIFLSVENNEIKISLPLQVL